MSDIVIFEAEDKPIEVRLEGDTVWLTQGQMVDLFDKTKKNISLHIRNIFKEGELAEGAVVKDSLTTANDGKQYKTRYYNLDVISASAVFRDQEPSVFRRQQAFRGVSVPVVSPPGRYVSDSG